MIDDPQKFVKLLIFILLLLVKKLEKTCSGSTDGFVDASWPEQVSCNSVKCVRFACVRIVQGNKMFSVLFYSTCNQLNGLTD